MECRALAHDAEGAAGSQMSPGPFVPPSVSIPIINQVLLWAGHHSGRQESPPQLPGSPVSPPPRKALWRLPTTGVSEE